MSVHHRRYSNMGVSPNYVMNIHNIIWTHSSGYNTPLEEVTEIKDPGVCFDSLLVFDKHISEKVNKAYMMFGMIKSHFAHILRNCFVTLYKSLVRSPDRMHAYGRIRNPHMSGVCVCSTD